MQIKVELDTIWIKTSDDITFEMNWKQLEELEKAIRIIRQIYTMESFISIEGKY